MAYVKQLATDAARSHGRCRVRILDTETGKLVSYPSGRVRWFGSEAAADEWIAMMTAPRLPVAARFRPRNLRSQRL